MERNLIVCRGLPGSGKSTFAELICSTVFTADDYFMKNGNYEFDATKLGQAHEWCQKQVQNAMEHGLSKVCVANTSTTERELKPYYDLAKKYGYKVFSVIVENRANTKNIHDVPQETIQKMKDRFSIKL